MENLRLGAKLGLKWVFIPFLIILVMSHNTFAISEPVQFVTSGYHKVYFYGGSGLSCYANCDFTTNTNTDTGVAISMIDLFVNNGPYYKNQILKFDLVLWKVSSSSSLHANLNDVQTNNANLALYSYETENLDTNVGVVHVYLRVLNDFTINNNNIRLQHGSGNNIFMFYLNPNERMSAGNWSLWYPLNFNVDTQSIVNAINSKDYTNVINNVNNSINSLGDNIDNINSDVEDATQDAADAAEDAANDNSSNSATTSLVGVLSSFLQAITNFSATDCNVVLNFPSYAGGTMTFNVCQYKDKAGNIVSVFTSLTLIVFYLPLAIKLLSMIYNEIRSFTNG